MSQDDPSKPEERASEKASRRRFLKGGAAALAALAATVVAKRAEAGVLNPDGSAVAAVFYGPNDLLANVIVRAWTDDDFRDDLLDPNPQKAKKALKKMGLVFEEVKVLTEDQYYAVGALPYKKTSWKEVVLVLPDAPKDVGFPHSLEVAKVKMQVTPFGM